MKHLGISGGGTKITGLFGAAEAILLDRNYKPDIISGISAGAILSVPLALGKYDEIKKLVLDYNLKTFFNVPPVKKGKKGKLRILNAIKRIIGKKHSFGEQYNLEKSLSKLVTKSDFENYKTNDDYAICIIGSVDFYTGKRIYVNLKTVSYDFYLKFVNASSSIPIYTEGIKFVTPITDFEGNEIIDEVLLFDGGVRDHSPTHKVLKSAKFDNKITETCSIFSRPNDLSDIMSSDFSPKTKKSITIILKRYIDIVNMEISKNDEALEKEVIKEKSIFNHGTFYLPKVMNSYYDLGKGKLKKLYDGGREAVQEGNWIDRVDNDNNVAL